MTHLAVHRDVIPSVRTRASAELVALVALVCVAFVGCGASSRSTRRDPRSGPVDRIEMEEVRISAARSSDGVSFETYDAQSLFERGNRELQAGRCESAITHFERIGREFGSSRFLSPALYNFAHCLERLGRLDDAVERFRELVRRVPRSRDVRDALFRIASLEERRQRWESLLGVTDQVLAIDELPSADRLEALSRRATALLGLRRLDDAERQARDATQFFRMRSEFDPIPDDTFVAQAQFTIAETWRLRAEGIVLPPGTAQQQHEALEARSRAILMAQTEYFNTIRVTNPEWSA
ncbi:MAG: tetratricopeptide repeat protein, partial [Deltaproteobacteria bacterium]|nr:tetratricopeptide repeat protein [Deltaproteobacteria bacterium]